MKQCCNIKRLFHYTSLCETQLISWNLKKISRGKHHSSALLSQSGCDFIFICCVWECVWQECPLPPWLLSQTAEYWTPNRTMNQSRATDGCHTSARKASMPLTQEPQVGYCCVQFLHSSADVLKLLFTAVSAWGRMLLCSPVLWDRGKTSSCKFNIFSWPCNWAIGLLLWTHNITRECW